MESLVATTAGCMRRQDEQATVLKEMRTGITELRHAARAEAAEVERTVAVAEAHTSQLCSIHSKLNHVATMAAEQGGYLTHASNALHAQNIVGHRFRATAAAVPSYAAWPHSYGAAQPMHVPQAEDHFTYEGMAPPPGHTTGAAGYEPGHPSAAPPRVSPSRRGRPEPAPLPQTPIATWNRA